MLQPIDYDKHQAQVYAQGRTISPDAVAAWMAAFARRSAVHRPLADDSCDLVLMYLVLHHVQDRPAAAAEIARVLRPQGRLLVRNTFADRVPDLLWHRYFPSARTVETRLFPTTAEVLEVFADAGLQRARRTVPGMPSAARLPPAPRRARRVPQWSACSNQTSCAAYAGKWERRDHCQRPPLVPGIGQSRRGRRAGAG